MTASAPAYFVDGLECRACTGWTGTGSVPASGSGTNATFALEEDSTLEWTTGPAEYRLELGVEGQGDVNAVSEWCQSGAMKVVTATAAQYWHFVEWEGDTAGCRITGATLRAPMTQGRSIRAVFAPDTCALAVENAFGAACPTNGTAFLNKGTAVSAWSAGVVEEGRTQTICTGWTGTGSVPASGAGTNAVFTLLEDSSITWAWQTNYLVRVTVVGDGTTDIGEAWIEAGSNLVVTAVAGETAYTSAVWSGDIDGAMIDGLSITIPVDGPRDIVMTFDALEMGDAIEQPSLVWTTAGAMAWTPVGDGAHDGADAAMAAAVGNGGYDDGTLRAVVDGGGELTFWWRLDVSSGSAGIDLRVDGEYAEDVWLVEETGWTQASVTLGEGSHTVEWIFWSDGGVAAAWLDEVSLPGDEPPLSETQTTPEPVPYAWLRDFYPEIVDEYDAYESTALATAANGVNKVWECYVAGLDPTDPTAQFLATITMDANGQPEISHHPPLSAAEEAKREYRILGAETLDAPEPWNDVTDVPDLDAAGYRFFKVKVEMQE